MLTAEQGPISLRHIEVSQDRLICMATRLLICLCSQLIPVLCMIATYSTYVRCSPLVSYTLMSPEPALDYDNEGGLDW